MKLIWSYIAEIEVQVANEKYGIIITPPKQCVMKVIGIHIKGGTLNRKWTVYHDLINQAYFEVFNGVPRETGTAGIYYPSQDYLGGFKCFDGEMLISNPDELDIYTSEVGTVGEWGVIAIRAELSTYAKPDVRLYNTTKNKVRTLHQDKIIGVLE